MIDLLQALSLVLPSLWKVYIGAVLAVPFGFTYLPMLLLNLLGVSIATLATISLSDWLKRRHQRPAQGFNRYLRLALRYWRRYGENGAALLAPILIGLPVYAFIARRLGMSTPKILLRLLFCSLLWCSVCFWAAQQGLLASAHFFEVPAFLLPAQ